MIRWGINALNHGSSLAVFSGNELISNTFDKTDTLSKDTIHRAFHYGGPSEIYWYERPWVKKTRQAYAGQWSRVFDLSELPSSYLKKINVPYAKIHYTPHHASHASAGYYTSPFNHCAIVVLDAIGEWECASIWEGCHGEIKKVWSRSYPNSLGLFYSAFTDLIGLTPVQDEFKLQQLAASGDPKHYYDDVKKYVSGILHMNHNLHKGVLNWPYPVNHYDHAHIAAAVQKVFEEQVCMIMTMARKVTGADSLVYMGGCAMNSQTNKLFQDDWKYIWSLPQPGDPSSSIGAVLYHTKQRVWQRWDPVKHIEIKV